MKVPVVTKDPKQSCPVAGFGRPHTWLMGAFYWPLNDCHSGLYVGDEYVMCGACGQTERDVL